MEWMKLKAGFKIFIYFDVLWTGTIASVNQIPFKHQHEQNIQPRLALQKLPPLPISEETKNAWLCKADRYTPCASTMVQDATRRPPDIEGMMLGGHKIWLITQALHHFDFQAFGLSSLHLIYLLKFGDLLEVQASFHSGAYATKWMSVAPCWLGKVNLKLCHILQCRPGWNVIEMRECKKKRALLLIRI